MTIIIRFTLWSALLAMASTHPMTAHLHDKMTPEMFAGMKSEAGQWLDLAQNKLKNVSTRFKAAKFNVQYSAVQKGLQWLDESEVNDKDKWGSKTFDFISKKKTELLGAMLNHYEERLGSLIDEKVGPQTFAQEFTQVAASDWKKVSPVGFQFLMQLPEARNSFISAADQDISHLNPETTNTLLTNLFIENEFGEKKINNDSDVQKLLSVVGNKFSEVDSETLSRIASKTGNSIDLMKQVKTKPLTTACVKNIFVYLNASNRALTNDLKSTIVPHVRNNFQDFNSNELEKLANTISSSELASLTESITSNINRLNAEALRTILFRTSFKSRGKILDAIKQTIETYEKDPTVIQNFWNEQQTFHRVDSILLKDKPELIKKQSQKRAPLNWNYLFARYCHLTALYNNYSIPWYRPRLEYKYDVVLALPSPTRSKKIDSEFNHLSQTQEHFLEHDDDIKETFQNAFAQTATMNFIKKIHQQEQKEQKDGRLTFVHGCKWDWDILQDLFTNLMAIKAGKRFKNYRFLRFEPGYENTPEQQTIRETLLSEGRTDDLRPKLLFMNHALFGNTTNSGSCTFSYWYDNRDMSKVDFNMKDIFKTAGFENYYSKYEQEIEELTQLHKQAENKGTLLLFSIDPKEASNYMYPAVPGGYKALFEIDGENNTNGSQNLTHNISKVVDILKTKPEKITKYTYTNKNDTHAHPKMYDFDSDRIEHCMILTNDYALNPKKAGEDIKIYPFSLGQDTPEYRKYCAKRNALMAKIKRDLSGETDSHTGRALLDFA